MRHRHLTRVGVLLAASLIAGAGAQAHDAAHHSATAPAQTGEEAPFLAENAAAMDKMMADMDVQPTGDIDVDFAAMMIPHHQGAIDMAVAYLRHGGRNPQLRRLAQEIVVEQQQEIIAMRLALGQPLPPQASAPTQPNAAPVAASASAIHDHAAMQMPVKQDTSP